MPKICPVTAEQPKMKLLRETFRATSELRDCSKSTGPATHGLITVEYGGHVIENVRCVLWASGSLFVYGFVARYQTGKKIWRASVSQLIPGEEPYISFGRMDRSITRRRNSTVWYAPKLYPSACS